MSRRELAILLPNHSFQGQEQNLTSWTFW